MRARTRRHHPRDSFNPPPPPPPPSQQQQQFSTDHHRQFTSRDSDASLASNRPSSIGVGGRSSIAATDLYADRNYQNSSIRVINAYLSSQSFSPLLPFPAKPHQLPSARDITEILRFLVSQLDYPLTKLEEDLFIVLKSLNCPFKVNKSTLRSPNSPHNWPSYLAVIHWLVQIAAYTQHLNQNVSGFVENNSMHMYALDSYLNYIHGDDDSVEALDREFMDKLERERDSVSENVRALENNFRELEAKAEGLRTGPTQREALEKERGVLEEDVKKFDAMITEFNGRIAAMEKVIEEKEREKAAKGEETRKISEENEELRKRVELQKVNARDAERMKRELQAVERDVDDAERARMGWEDKAWDLGSTIAHKLKELEAIAMECNQAIKRFINF